MGARRRGREAALQMLCARDASGGSAESIEQNHWAHLAATHEGRDFGSALVRGVLGQLEDIDRRLREVSEHWRLERMPTVDRNILRLGTYELTSLPEVPRRVTLNEAVELAKRYGGEGSPGFVNGVLDRIADEVEKE